MSKHRLNVTALFLAAAATAATFAGADALARRPWGTSDYVVVAHATASAPHGATASVVPVAHKGRHIRI